MAFRPGGIMEWLLPAFVVHIAALPHSRRKFSRQFHFDGWAGGFPANMCVHPLFTTLAASSRAMRREATCRRETESLAFNRYRLRTHLRGDAQC